MHSANMYVLTSQPFHTSYGVSILPFVCLLAQRSKRKSLLSSKYTLGLVPDTNLYVFSVAILVTRLVRFYTDD